MSVTKVFSHSRDASDGFGNMACRGEVERILDHRISKTAFRLSGAAPQSNFLRCPKSAKASLRLTGELLYAQMCAGPRKYVLHYDIETATGDIVRLSMGNIYTEAKTYRNAAGTVVQVALPDSLETGWFVVAVDITAVLGAFEHTSHLQYKCLRAVQACASMILRNVFVASEVFTPETMPRDMQFPVPSSASAWSDVYNWHWLVSDPRPARLDSRHQRTVATIPTGVRRPASKPVASKDSGGTFELTLGRCAGYSGDRAKVLTWSRDGDSLIYACNSTIVVHDLKSDNQRFIFGHTNAINSVLLSNEGSILATAQVGKFPHIRLWDWKAGKCIAILRASPGPMAKSDRGSTPPDKPVVAMTFDPEDAGFMAVTRGRRSNFVVCAWKLLSKVGGNLEFKLAARHTLECDVRCLEYSPLGPQQFVTCGAENVRFWRLKDGHLHSRPVALGPHVNTTFTAIAFEAVYSDDPQGRRVFIGTDQGSIFQVHGPSASLQVIYKVHSGAINSMHVNESFCVTGSDDAYVRVWPLDFVDYFLEAHHDAAITSMDVSLDGLHIAIGTEQGAIGLLSVGDQIHRNVLRSHSDAVTGLAIDVHDSMAATAAADGTIRVWSLREPYCQQLYEIEASGEAPLCVCFRPDSSAEAAHIACGFDSGTVRIFVVEHTKLLHEYCQHKAGVYDVCFANDGQLVFSLSLDDNICIYDVHTQYQPMKLIPLRGPAVASSWPLPSTAAYAHTGLTLALSHDTHFVAAVSADGREIVITNTLICTRVAAYSLDTDAIGRITCCCFGPPSEGVEPTLCLLAATTSLKLISINLNQSGHTTILSHNIHCSACRTIAMSPDGRLVATGGNDQFVKLWRLSGGTVAEPLTYIAHSAAVNSLAFNHRGTSLISVGDDETVLLWGVDCQAAHKSRSQQYPLEVGEEVGPLSQSVGIPAKPESKEQRSFFSVAQIRASTNRAVWVVGKQACLVNQNSANQILPTSRGIGLCAADLHHVAVAEPVAGPDDVATIEVWSLGDQPTKLADLRYHDHGVAAMEFLPAPAGGAGCPLLVSAGVAVEGCIVIWNLRDGIVLKAQSVSRPIDMIRSVDSRSFVAVGAGRVAFCRLNGSDLDIEDIQLVAAAPWSMEVSSTPTYSISAVEGGASGIGQDHAWSLLLCCALTR